MNKLSFLFLLITVGVGSVGLAQEMDAYTYTREFRYGVNKNSYGGLIGGVIAKQSFANSDRYFTTYGLELVNITHPIEYSTRSNATGNIYKFGKMNTLYSIRLQYGRDLILFKKAPQQGAQVMAMVAIGPSLGIVAPYYIDLGAANGAVPYDPNNSQHRVPENILGTGGVLQGVLSDPSVVFGSNLKLGLSFEFGVFKKNVTGFEVGFLIEGYTKEIQIIDGAEPLQILPTSFISIFWGNRK